MSTAPPSSSPRSRPLRGTDETFFWLLATAFLVVVGLFHALLLGVALFQSVAAIPIAHQSPDKVGMIATAAIRMVTLLPAVALLRVLDQRFRLIGERGSAFRVLGGLVVAGTVEWWLFLAGVRLVDWCRGADVMTIIPTSPYGISYRVMVLGVGMLLFALGSQWQRMKSLELRTAEAEAALRTSELQRLEAQLQPHFLFNALTAVLACRHDPEAVASVTIGLSEHLRFCLSRQGALELLSREIDALEHYLAVQRARFGKTLDCRIDGTREARGVHVPPVIIEPLLDNALKHGAITSPAPLRIVVDCRMEGSTLVVTVDNSGAWIEPGADGRRGTGLANLRKRLDLLDFRDAVLESGPAGEGVRASLRLPLAPPPGSATTLRTAFIGDRR
ncbi:MAG: histidine kinase [Planctomycetia bacterium]